MSGEGCIACEGRKGSPAMYIIVALTFVCMGACLLSCVWGFIYPQEKTEEEEKEKEEIAQKQAGEGKASAKVAPEPIKTETNNTLRAAQTAQGAQILSMNGDHEEVEVVSLDDSTCSPSTVEAPEDVIDSNVADDFGEDELQAVFGMGGMGKGNRAQMGALGGQSNGAVVGKLSNDIGNLGLDIGIDMDFMEDRKAHV